MSNDKTPSQEAAELRNRLEGLRATDPTPHVEAAKQQAADTASTVASNVSDTVSQAAATIMDKAAAARDTVMDAGARVADAVGGAVESARSTAQHAGESKAALSERIRDQPFLALGLAVLTGYVLGRAYR